MNPSLSHSIEPNGDLRISASKEVQAEIQELRTENPDIFDSDLTMYDVLEYIVCNGLSWTSPEDVGALTSAPILCEGIDDDGNPVGEVWGFMNYQVTNPQTELANNGYCIWQKG